MAGVTEEAPLTENTLPSPENDVIMQDVATTAEGKNIEERESENERDDESENNSEDEDHSENESESPSTTDSEKPNEESDDYLKDLNPIQNHLEVLLKLTEVDYKGTFSYQKTYKDAPYPGLRLSDLGVVGLPLSLREAEVVKSKCELAPFGKGERTLVDKTVRDTWQMEASQVEFGDPRWAKFLSGVVKEVCEALGVNYIASQPRCELHKLLLYETGSHFLPHVDTEKQDGMFATVVVVLPSEFTGGAAHLSHGKLSKVYDCSATSQHGISVLAWYTDVTHEIKPITSGYRLALSYNLVHTTKSLRPALSANKDLASQLRDRLITWKNDKGLHSPEKLLYLLDHTYSQANLQASALKGVDAHKVAMLDPIAQELGFRLGLASVEYYQSGGATEDHDYPRRFAYIEEKKLSITCFKDMEGQLIRSTLEVDKKTETIPSKLADHIAKGDEYDEEEHGEYTGNEAGDLERWYHRSVLVIWPSWSKYNLQYKKDEALSHALADLKNITIPSRSPDESELIDFVLSRCSEDPIAAAPILTDMSLLWDDIVLWNRAVKTCCVTEGLEILFDEDLQRAVVHFGLEAVRPGLEEMLNKDPSNASRFAFLDNFQKWITGLADDTPDKAALQEWATSTVTKVLKTLKAPYVDEQKLLISLAVKHGGVEYLKDHMLPQLVSIADSTFLRKFATTVHKSTAFSEESVVKSTVVSGLLAAAISRECFFKPITSYSDSETEYLDLTKVYIKTVQDLGLSHMVDDIIDRVTDTSKLDDKAAQQCSRNVMIPLIIFLGEARSDLPTHFLKLQQEGMRLYLRWLLLETDRYRSRNSGVFKTLLNAGLASGDAQVFADSVRSFIEGKDSKLDSTELRQMINEVKANRDRLVSSGLDDTSVQSLVGALATRTASCESVAYISHVVSALDWCMTMNIPNLWNVVTERFITYVEQISADWLEERIAPDLPKLQACGVKHQKDVNLVVQKTVAAWMKKVLGTPPAAYSVMTNRLTALAKWTCSCRPCSDARNFLTTISYTASTTIYHNESPHTVQHLVMHAKHLATWTIHGSYTLKITKSDDLVKLLQWRKFQPQGVALLKDLSADENELRNILGPEYESVKAALADPPVEQTSTSAATSDSETDLNAPAAKKRKLH